MVSRLRRPAGRFGGVFRLAAAAALAGGLALPAAAEPLARAPAALDAPALTLPRLDGSTFDLADRAGRVTVVNFWALWCAPCKIEMPDLVRLQRRLAGTGIAVVAVNLGDDPARVRRFVEDNGLGDLTVVLEQGANVSETWHVGGLPTTYVVDPAGRIAYAALGARPWADDGIATLLERLSQAE